MTVKLADFDPAKYLDSEEAVEAFLQEAFATEDAKFIAQAIGVAARAKSMTDIAKKSGISREALYKILSEDGNPTLKTLLPVLSALGLSLSVSGKNQHVHATT